jgi:hypothetical protein
MIISSSDIPAWIGRKKNLKGQKYCPIILKKKVLIKAFGGFIRGKKLLLKTGKYVRKRQQDKIEGEADEPVKTNPDIRECLLGHRGLRCLLEF